MSAPVQDVVLDDVSLQAIAKRWILARLGDRFGDMPHGGALLTRGEVDRINEGRGELR